MSEKDRPFRISRPCYDKYHRCPGWAGPGWRFPKVDTCHNGYIDWSERGFRMWRFNRCNKCGVLVLPYNSRWLDPRWWWYWLPMKIRRMRDV